MSDDIQNNEEGFTSAQENNVAENLEETNLDSGGEISESNVEEEAEQKAESNTDDEKVVLTKKEYEKEIVKHKEIAKRRARRELERDLADKVEQNKAQQSAQQPVQQPQQSDLMWDENLNAYISKEISVREYEQWVTTGVKPQSVIQRENSKQAANNQQSQAQMPKNAEKQVLSDDAEDQAIACQADFDDFADVIKNAAVTPEMVNAAANDKNGIKNLYEIQKSNPQKLFEISKLPKGKQAFAVWNLNNEVRRNSSKIVSTASKQPKALGSSKIIKNDWDSMSDSDLRAALRDKY
jgi:hypothetical protein